MALTIIHDHPLSNCDGDDQDDDHHHYTSDDGTTTTHKMMMVMKMMMMMVVVVVVVLVLVLVLVLLVTLGKAKERCCCHAVAFRFLWMERLDSVSPFSIRVNGYKYMPVSKGFSKIWNVTVFANRSQFSLETPL
jgi:hypothetical protein